MLSVFEEGRPLFSFRLVSISLDKDLEGWNLRAESRRLLRWIPHPVIVTIMDNKDYIRVLLYSYYTTLYHYYRVGGPPKRLRYRVSGCRAA